MIIKRLTMTKPALLTNGRTWLAWSPILWMVVSFAIYSSINIHLRCSFNEGMCGGNYANLAVRLFLTASRIAYLVLFVAATISAFRTKPTIFCWIGYALSLVLIVAAIASRLVYAS
jgi:hypothetical protein